MRDALTDLSRTEFESLPPAVQRKFFSNVERFRLLTAQHLPTHQHDNEQQHPDLAANSLRHPLTAVSSNRPGAISQQSDRSFQQGTGHKLSSCRIASLTTQAQGKSNAGHPPGRSHHIGIDPTLIHEYLQCFHSLPPKIQKTIFSQEEQRILRRTAPLASNIVDAADWALFRHKERRRASRRRQSLLTDSSSDRAVRPRRRYRRSRSSPPSPAGRSSLGPSLTTSLYSTPREEPPEVASRAESTGDPSDSGIEMESTFLDTFRWLDEDEDLDLSLDSYHKYVADAALSSQQVQGTTSPRRMPSFRRTLSLAKNRNSLFLGGSRGLSSSQSSTLPFTATSTRVIDGHSRSPDAHHTRNLSHRSTSSIDPAAQYYQDPDARLKLRVYLASPQKFDEAIELGFPSLDKENNDGGIPGRRNVNRDSKRISQISISTHATTHGWTFLDDETTSIDLSLFDLTDLQSSQISPRSPPEKLLPTPCIREVTAPVPISSSTEPRNHRRPQPLKPIGGNADNSHRPGGSGHRREMTLKMTLTRPDLRTVGDAGFLSHDRLDDPLRLAELPPADEACHIWDDLPAERGVVKKMWRKLRSWKD